MGRTIAQKFSLNIESNSRTLYFRKPEDGEEGPYQTDVSKHHLNDHAWRDFKWIKENRLVTVPALPQTNYTVKNYVLSLCVFDNTVRHVFLRFENEFRMGTRTRYYILVRVLKTNYLYYITLQFFILKNPDTSIYCFNVFF